MPVVTYDHDDGLLDHRRLRVPRRGIPGLHGWYLYGDYCTGFVDAVPADEPTATRSGSPAASATSSSFGELEDGELVLLTAAGVQRVLPRLSALRRRGRDRRRWPRRPPTTRHR